MVDSFDVKRSMESGKVEMEPDLFSKYLLNTHCTLGIKQGAEMNTPVLMVFIL